MEYANLVTMLTISLGKKIIMQFMARMTDRIPMDHWRYKMGKWSPWVSGSISCYSCLGPLNVSIVCWEY
jgi:hypothetical protein